MSFPARAEGLVNMLSWRNKEVHTFPKDICQKREHNNMTGVWIHLLQSSMLATDETPKPRSNGNEQILLTSQRSRTGFLLLDAVECHSQTISPVRVSYLSVEDTALATDQQWVKKYHYSSSTRMAFFIK